MWFTTKQFYTQDIVVDGLNIHLRGQKHELSQNLE